MDVHAHLLFGDGRDDGIALLFRGLCDTQHVEVVAALPIADLERRHDEAIITCESRGVPLANGLTARCGLRIETVQFHQTDSGLDIGHVALPAREGHIVAPGARLCLGQGILALTMEAHGVEVAVELLMIEGFGEVQGERTSFCSGEVLHRVEAEAGDIGLCSDLLAAHIGTEGMGGIGQDQRPAQAHLRIGAGHAKIHFRCEEVASLFRYAHDGFDVRGQPSDIHRNDRLGAVGEHLADRLGVHGEVVEHIHQDGLGAHVHHDVGGGTVGVCGHDHLIAWSHAVPTQHQFAGIGPAIEGDGTIHATIGGDTSFELLGARSGGDPSAAQSLLHGLDGAVIDAGRAEWDHLRNRLLVGEVRIPSGCADTTGPQPFAIERVAKAKAITAKNKTPA